MRTTSMLRSFERRGYKVSTDMNSGNVFIKKDGHAYRYPSLTAAYNYHIKTTRL